MSDWNPNHISAWETDRASSKEIAADDTELDRRAAALRARDDRIEQLEAAIKKALLELLENDDGEPMDNAIAILQPALADKEESGG